jgi:hypothetical protein
MYILFLQIVLHEVCHLIGLQHCVFFDCAMNESNSLEMALSQPLFPCPICLRKIQYVCRFRLQDFYTGMLNMCEELQGEFPSYYTEQSILWLRRCMDVIHLDRYWYGLVLFGILYDSTFFVQFMFANIVFGSWQNYIHTCWLFKDWGFFEKNSENGFFSENGWIEKPMMSVCFDNLKFFCQFLCPVSLHALVTEVTKACQASRLHDFQAVIRPVHPNYPPKKFLRGKWTPEAFFAP